MYCVALRIHSGLFTVAKRTSILRENFWQYFKVKVTLNVNILNIVIVILFTDSLFYKHPHRGK